MAYGKNKGRFRETRASRFAPNMGADAAPVKSIDGVKSISCRMHNKIKGLLAFSKPQSSQK
jgi:hypothetical protein